MKWLYQGVVAYVKYTDILWCLSLCALFIKTKEEHTQPEAKHSGPHHPLSGLPVIWCPQLRCPEFQAKPITKNKDQQSLRWKLQHGHLGSFSSVHWQAVTANAFNISLKNELFMGHLTLHKHSQKQQRS